MRLSRRVIRVFFSIASVAVSCTFLPPTAHGSTFVVDTTLDYADDNPGDGVCFSTSANGCTFRAAIEEANAKAGADRIHFNLGGGAGVKTIRPSFLTIIGTSDGPLGLAFPPIREEVSIDGRTQGGPHYTGRPLIEIDGSTTPLADAGIYVSSGSTVVRGLIINNFSAPGIWLVNRGGNSVEGCYIGTDADGTSPRPNAIGILIQSRDNTVGGAGTEQRNLISGNGTGLEILGDSANRNWVLGNFIGTDLDGSDNRIGTLREGEANTIAFNRLGVLVLESAGADALGNSVRGNSLFANSDGEIALASSVGISNDPLDADTGPNNLQNFPDLVGAESVDDKTVIEGSLKSLANTSFFIDFYSSPSCSPSGRGEGKVFLRSIGITTDADGAARFKVEIDELQPAGSFITATAVNQDTLDTSELSTCVEVTNPYVVTNTEDSGPGSLRQAIRDANASPGASEIRFLILERGPLHAIELGTPLPEITEPVSILGSTQPTFVEGSELIRLEGSRIGAAADGLHITAGNSLVEGLAIGGFKGSGILIERGGNNVIQGCFLGTDGEETLEAGNRDSGVTIVGSSDNVIGGVEPGKGNWIALNGAGVRVVNDHSRGNRIRGNAIYKNAGLGIDLGDLGRDANDVNDADGGANDLQNHPVLESAVVSSGQISITGTLNSEADSEYVIDFHASLPGDGGASGRSFLGSVAVTTIGHDVAFAVTLPLADPRADRIVATATRKSAPFDTSELSAPLGITVRGGWQVPGDCNQDGRLDISDASCVVGFLFQGSPSRLPCGDGSNTDPGNIALIDWQPDGKTDISDAVGLVTFLFSGGAPHPLSVSGNETRGCVEILGCSDTAACPES